MPEEGRRPIRWSAHARLDALADPDSLQGSWGSTGRLWVGSARVEGRPAALLVSEVKVDRGALSAEAAERAADRVRSAARAGDPVIWLVDSDGAEVAGGLPAVERSAALLDALAEAEGRSLRLAVCHGFAGGVSGYGLALCDLAIGIASRSFTFVAGPAVVQAATGEASSLDEIGGTPVQLAAGTLAAEVAADPQALAWVRAILALHRPIDPIQPGSRGFELPEPSRPYRAQDLAGSLVDEGSYLPLFEGYGPSVRVGLARIEGRSVVWIQSDPSRLSGAIDVHAARKVARILALAKALGRPVITLCDTPGFLPGAAQERAGILGAGAELIHAYARARAVVPTASVVIRRAVGAGAVLLFGSADRFALPGAEVVQMGARAARSAYEGPGRPGITATMVELPRLREALGRWVALDGG